LNSFFINSFKLEPIILAGFQSFLLRQDILIDGVTGFIMEDVLPEHIRVCGPPVLKKIDDNRKNLAISTIHLKKWLLNGENFYKY
jgi:hypothetical protein